MAEPRFEHRPAIFSEHTLSPRGLKSCKFWAQKRRVLPNLSRDPWRERDSKLHLDLGSLSSLPNHLYLFLVTPGLQWSQSPQVATLCGCEAIWQGSLISSLSRQTTPPQLSLSPAGHKALLGFCVSGFTLLRAGLPLIKHIWSPKLRVICIL